MNSQNHYYHFSPSPGMPPFYQNQSDEQKPNKKGVSIKFLIGAICIAVAFAVMITYLFAYASVRKKYINDLLIQQQQIDMMQTALGDEYASIGILTALLNQYSLYGDSMSQEALVKAVLAEYSRQTGDRYAAYYTKEEYEQAFTPQEEYCGIGISTLTGTLRVGDDSYAGYLIEDIYNSSPAELAGVHRGDFIYQIKTSNGFELVNALGIDGALNHLKGEQGKEVAFRVFRKQSDGTYLTVELSMVCALISPKTVSYALREGDASCAIVRIDSFGLDTPLEFKQAVNTLKKQGVTRFVFDLRNNPGGDLQSVKAILSFFLKDGDLILTAQKLDGSNATPYYAESVKHIDPYVNCSVLKAELGMYRDLDAVVLCNENTASAAEVFVAAFRDYKLAPIVGTTTYGKGIMQTVFNLSTLGGGFDGYVKLTTYAYVPMSGESYHEDGIEPDHVVERSDEAKQYHHKETPQDKDNQLQAAFSHF